MPALLERSLDCAFCVPEKALRGRIIKVTPLVVSFVSSPWGREGHVVVAPRGHRRTIEEVTDKEYLAIKKEMGRLAARLQEDPDPRYDGRYTRVQKFDDLRVGNGVTMEHFHEHFLPFFTGEQGVFAIPLHNSFDDFVQPSPEQINQVLRKMA